MGRSRIKTFGITVLISVVASLLLYTNIGWAQTGPSLSTDQQDGENEAQTSTILCSSVPGERQHCPADTSAGVLLSQSTGPIPCLLGKTWGYDDQGVWVMDGCVGEFFVARTVSPAAAGPASPPVAVKPAYKPIETWGEFDPGNGFVVGKTDFGELDISGYALVRYVNQLPAEQNYTDHLGNEHPVDTRNDIFSHRIMVFFKGWLGNPKLIYNIFLWTVNSTDQKAIFRIIGLPVQPEIQPLRRHQRAAGNAFGARIAPVLAGSSIASWPTSFSGPISPLGYGPAAKSVTGALVQRHGGEQPERAWNHGCPVGSEVLELRLLLLVDADHKRIWSKRRLTGTGRGTRRWPHGSASRQRSAPSNGSPMPVSGNPDNTVIKLADSLNRFRSRARLAPGVTVRQTTTACFRSMPE